MFKIYFSLMVAIFSVAFIHAAAFAQTLPADVTAQFDVFKLIAEVIANPSVLKGIFVGFLAVLLTVQFLKSTYVSKIFKGLTSQMQFALITILGQVYALAYKVLIAGESVDAVLVGALSSGMAVSIYQAVKLLFGKKKKEIVGNEL